MKVYFAADHAGFELKNELLNFVRGQLNFEAVDCGALTFVEGDDYPPIIALAARKLYQDVKSGLESRAIVIGASGQGEAMIANRFFGVRAAVYYGPAAHPQKDAAGNELDMIASIRIHNNANCLSLGARFISIDDAKEAVRAWLSTPFGADERHARRITEIDQEAHE